MFLNKSGGSKRNLKRLLKKEKAAYVEKLIRKKNQGACVENIVVCNTELHDLGEATAKEIVIEESSYKEQFECKKPTFKEKLGAWYYKYRPSRESFEELLCILNEENLNVPKSAKSFGIKIKPLSIKNVIPGLYCHVGIKNQLTRISHILKNWNEIAVDINIDGLPLFKSSSIQLWPILMRITNFGNVSVFAVGIYLGKKKPGNIDIYLKELVEELEQLFESGFKIENKTIPFRVRAIVCDSPAKAFICGIPGHTSFHGCSKCCQTGKQINNVTTYSVESSQLISDEDFTSRRYLKHHQKKFHENKTPFERANIKMVSQVPLDPMHLVDLGVTRKILLRLIRNKTSFKVDNQKKMQLSNHLTSLKKFIPKEFSRCPRELDELLNWKASEFRQFVLYTGIIVFKNQVDDDFYYEFLLLHCAYRLLCCPRTCARNADNAQKLLELFVENFPIIFGESSVTYNIHGLLHLSGCVKEFGPCPNFSAYAFENYLQILKKYVKKPSKIFQQICARIQCENMVLPDPKAKFNEKNGKIISYSSESYLLTTKTPDNLCIIKPFIPIIINDFSSVEPGYVIGRRLRQVYNFFTEPVDSLSVLGTCLVNLNDLGDIENFKITDIECKLIGLPHKEKFVLLPILHGCS